MSNYDDILHKALALSEKDRLWLAEELIISVRPPGMLSADDPGFMDEIMRRSNELHNGATDLIPGEVAIQKLDKIISRNRSDRGNHTQ